MRLDQEGEVSDSLSLTPLIDVVFLLLIFFLVSTTFAKDEVEMDLKLPQAKSGKAGKEGQYLVIQFSRDGALLLAGRKVTLEGLQQKLRAQGQRDRSRAVLIRGDVDARYGLFAKVMDACRSARLEKILIRALPEGGRPR
jgi:biopolymer transport protein ExbD